MAASPSVGPSSRAGWQRTPDEPAFRDSALGSVIWTGSRFLATAWTGDSLLLDSLDGRAWNRQPPFEITPWSTGPHLVAAGPGRLVAFGGGSNGPLTAWLSSDGLAWTEVPDQDAFHATDGAFQELSAVIASDDGWVAVGREFHNCQPRCPLRAVVLVSDDGRRWTRLAQQPALRDAEMFGIARGPSGLIAVGSVMVDPARGEAGLRAAAWTSSDGRAWTLAPPSTFAMPARLSLTGPTDVVLRAVAARGDRLVILGDARPTFGSDTEYVAPLAIAWWSDGAAWTPVTIGPFYDTAEVKLAVVPAGYLAITGSDADCASALWASADGSAWRCGGTDLDVDRAVVTGAAASPDLEVLVGRSLTDPDGAAAVWTLALR